MQSSVLQYVEVFCRMTFDAYAKRYSLRKGRPHIVSTSSRLPKFLGHCVAKFLGDCVLQKRPAQNTGTNCNALQHTATYCFAILSTLTLHVVSFAKAPQARAPPKADRVAQEILRLF